MTSKARSWLVGGALGALVLLALGWFLVVSPKRSQAAAVRDETATQESANTVLRQQIAMLQAQAKGLVAKQAALQEVGRRVPPEPQLPALVRNLTGVHDRSGADIISITPAAPVSAVPTVPGAAAYSTIPVTLQVAGDYAQLTLFLDELERLERLYVVKGVQISSGKAPAPGDKVVLGPAGDPLSAHTLTATITGEVYTTSAATTSVSLPGLTATGRGSAGGGAPAPPAAPGPRSASGSGGLGAPATPTPTS